MAAEVVTFDDGRVTWRSTGAGEMFMGVFEEADFRNEFWPVVYRHTAFVEPYMVNFGSCTANLKQIYSTFSSLEVVPGEEGKVI